MASAGQLLQEYSGYSVLTLLEEEMDDKRSEGRFRQMWIDDLMKKLDKTGQLS